MAFSGRTRSGRVLRAVSVAAIIGLGMAVALPHVAYAESSDSKFQLLRRKKDGQTGTLREETNSGGHGSHALVGKATTPPES